MIPVRREYCPKCGGVTRVEYQCDIDACGCHRPPPAPAEPSVPASAVACIEWSHFLAGVGIGFMLGAIAAKVFS